MARLAISTLAHLDFGSQRSLYCGCKGFPSITAIGHYLHHEPPIFSYPGEHGHRAIPLRHISRRHTLTIERLRTPPPSIPRNPLITDPLFLARYIEKTGTGTFGEKKAFSRKRYH